MEKLIVRKNPPEPGKHTRSEIREDIALPIGETITLLCSEERRFEGKILGYEHKHFIVVRLQGHLGQGPELKTGEKINAHFIKSQFSVAFWSRMLARFSFDSFLLVFCQYPQTFLASTQRISSRVDCLLPATIKAEDRLALGVITNVSFKGCQVSMDYQRGKSLRGLSIGQKLSIFVNPFQSNAPGRELVCRIEYVLRGQFGIKFGVSFINIGASAVNTIKEYIKGQQAQWMRDELLANDEKEKPEEEKQREEDGEEASTDYSAKAQEYAEAEKGGQAEPGGEFHQAEEPILKNPQAEEPIRESPQADAGLSA